MNFPAQIIIFHLFFKTFNLFSMQGNDINNDNISSGGAFPLHSNKKKRKNKNKKKQQQQAAYITSLNANLPASVQQKQKSQNSSSQPSSSSSLNRNKRKKKNKANKKQVPVPASPPSSILSSTSKSDILPSDQKLFSQLIREQLSDSKDVAGLSSPSSSSSSPFSTGIKPKILLQSKFISTKSSLEQEVEGNEEEEEEEEEEEVEFIKIQKSKNKVSEFDVSPSGLKSRFDKYHIASSSSSTSETRFIHSSDRLVEGERKEDQVAEDEKLSIVLEFLRSHNLKRTEQILMNELSYWGKRFLSILLHRI